MIKKNAVKKVGEIFGIDLEESIENKVKNVVKYRTGAGTQISGEFHWLQLQ